MDFRARGLRPRPGMTVFSTLLLAAVTLDGAPIELDAEAGRCGNLIMPSGSIWIGSFSNSSRSPLGFWSNSSTSPFGIEAMKCSEAASVTALAKTCGATIR
jgi:hypothetical protein